MPSNTTVNAILGVAALIALLAAAYIWMPRGTAPEMLLETMQTATGTSSQNALNDGAEADNGLRQFSVVNIAVLDTERVASGPTRGCDRVAYVERSVAPTPAPLGAALRELFSIDDERVGGYYNFIARTNETLSFDRVTIEGGVAHVYLTGSLTGLAGVCDNPRAAIQIEETALQFPSVRSVKLFLNGSETRLMPDERGE